MYWDLNSRQTLRQHGPSCYLEFTERSHGTYLMIIKPRRRLLMVEKVIRLSVIVPFFNVERYAAENLASLAQNAAPGIEFVLVDDASTDATSSIIAERAELLPEAQLIRLKRNSGAIGRPQCGPVGCARPLSELSRRRRCRCPRPLFGTALK